MTGAIFCCLSAAYDTVNHRILTKIYQMTNDKAMTTPWYSPKKQDVLCGSESKKVDGGELNFAI